MIAASAIQAKATLATQNPEDFQRFQVAGLQIVTG
jgi:predicted nucleic acid-binding protein